MPVAILRIGLTGGIGSGKSTVARTLADCGAAIIDADAISRALTAPGGLAIPAIAQRFGAQFINAEGAMNRDLMRELAFSDPVSRHQLESIIHPLVTDEVIAQTQRAIIAGRTCVVFDVPLLVESGRWRQQVDRVLVVDCTEATQIDRVTTRNKFTREAVEKIIAGQATRGQRLAAADICIFNEGLSLGSLDSVTRQLARSFGL
jgi:dephospho-CoA kinase